MGDALLSAAGALDCAMRIPGALAVSIGEIRSGATLSAVRRTDEADQADVVPPAYSGAAIDMCAGYGAFCGPGQDLEEFVLTGTQTYFVLRVVPLSSGAGHAFLHIALDRSQTNLALARIDIKTLGERIPLVVETYCLEASANPSPLSPQGAQPPQIPGRDLPRREPTRKRTTAQPPMRSTDDDALLHRLVAGLRRL
ncbi:hypothetical protein ABIA33_006260 [Streptacidiphilus sp. MAP12-16]